MEHNWIVRLVIVIYAFAQFVEPTAICKAAEPYEIVMQFPCTGEVPEGLKDVEEAVNNIIEEKIGSVLQLKPVDSPAFDANIMIAKGEKLDLCLSLYGSIVDLINQGDILPLDKLIDHYGKSIKEMGSVQLCGGRYNGVIYGVPTVYAIGKRYGFICRKDMADKYGFELKEGKCYSFDELEKFFRRVKDGEGKDFFILGGSVCRNGQIERAACLFDVMGADVTSGVLMLDQNMKTKKIVNFYETKQFAEFANRMYRWQQQGFFMPNTSITEESANSLMKNNRILGWFFHNVPGEEAENAFPSGREVVYIPTQEAVQTTDVYQDALWSIPTTCEKPEKVMEFLNLLYTDEEVINLLQRGIEGISYVVKKENENGKLIDFPEGKTVDTVPYYIEAGIYGNRLKAYTWVPGDVNRNKIIQDFNDEISLVSPAWGYVFDSESVSVELAGIREVVDKYIGIIETGAVDPRIELPMFLEELSQTGIDQVIAENQRQFDRFRNS